MRTETGTVERRLRDACRRGVAATGIGPVARAPASQDRHRNTPMNASDQTMAARAATPEAVCPHAAKSVPAADPGAGFVLRRASEVEAASAPDSPLAVHADGAGTGHDLADRDPRHRTRSAADPRHHRAVSPAVPGNRAARRPDGDQQGLHGRVHRPGRDRRAADRRHAGAAEAGVRRRRADAGRIPRPQRHPGPAQSGFPAAAQPDADAGDAADGGIGPAVPQAVDALVQAELELRTEAAR
jgi:hypothetical protein